jgi:hypothetical protein
VIAALARGETPRRPGSKNADPEFDEDEDGWDEDEDEDDWDEIDDSDWTLIMKCFVPRPQDRLQCSAIQELIVDMNIWDDRPIEKGLPGAEILKLRSNSEIHLDRVDKALSQIQVYQSVVCAC